MNDVSMFTSPFDHIDYCIVRNQSELDIAIEKTGSENLNFIAEEKRAYTFIYSGNQRAVACVMLHEDSIKNKAILYQLLVHECVHVWQEIRERMGEENPSIEFEAYSVQQIFNDLLIEAIKD